MTTFREARRALAGALHDLETHVVSASTATQTSSLTLVNRTPDASTDTYDGRYAYIAEGFATGAQTFIMDAGHDPTLGRLEVGKYWDTMPRPADVLELTGLFPAVGPILNAQASYRGLLNEAARYLMVPDYLEVPIVANQRQYPLPAQAGWLDRNARFQTLLDPPRRAGDPPLPSSRRWTPRYDGGVPSVVFTGRAYPRAVGAFRLGVVRPGDTLVNGAEGRGFVAETDAILPGLPDLTEVGLWLAYRALAMRAHGRPSGNWGALMAAQEARVEKLATLDRTLFVQTQEADRAARRRRGPSDDEATTTEG